MRRIGANSSLYRSTYAGVGHNHISKLPWERDCGAGVIAWSTTPRSRCDTTPPPVRVTINELALVVTQFATPRSISNGPFLAVT
jgi:hypothetical protein